MGRLRHPEEAQNNQEEPISNIVTLLNHAVHELHDYKQDNHEGRHGFVEHWFGSAILRTEDSVHEPLTRPLHLFDTLRESHHESEDGREFAGEVRDYPVGEE